MPTPESSPETIAQEATAPELEPQKAATGETPPPPPPSPEPDEETSTAETTDDPTPNEILEKLKKKAEAEAARYRRQLRELETELASIREKEKVESMTVEERLKAAEERAAKAEADATARILAAERRAALAGKVSHPERVLRLMDDPDSYFDGSEPQTDRIVGDFPEYAIKAAPPAAAPVPGGGGSAPRQAPLDDASAALARGDIRAYAAALAQQQQRALNPKE